MFRNPSFHPRRLGALVAVGALAAALLPTSATTAEAGADEQRLPYRDASLPVAQRVDDLLDRMTLAEKVGQMTQAERIDVDADPSLITTYALGSVLSGGGSVPTPNTPEGWADMVDRYQQAALDSRLGIPLIYGVDSVHGHGNLQGATVFPHNIGLGATRDPALVKRIGHVTALETRATGPQWAFAPCICVARDDRWGRTYESFGETPGLVKSMETAIDGLQGRPGQLDHPDRVLASAKHFAGDGLTAFDTGEGDYTIDQGIDQVSRREFDRLALAPYRTAVRKHHVGSVMPSFSSVDWTEDGLGNPVKMHANRELITDVLKGDLGFDGFVITDWRAIRQLPGTYADQLEASVMAGVDMFMEPKQAPNNPTGWQEDFIPTLTQLVEDDVVPISRIDDAVSRILTAKFELGLFEHPLTDRSNLDQVGSRAHHALARAAAAESQVLLRNKQRTLPLKPRQNVYVAGSNADNIGNQAGGWTLTWQGGSTNVIPGTTILDGIKSAAHGKVVYSETAETRVPRKSVGVVVVGETPYAEGFGDVGGPRWAYDPGDGGVARPEKTMRLSEADTKAVRKVCARTTSCAVLVVSGRPMVLPPRLLQQTDALVASWLPGSEGAGVADVLYGNRPFTGRLPVSWPRTVDQEPINVGDRRLRPALPLRVGAPHARLEEAVVRGPGRGGGPRVHAEAGADVGDVPVDGVHAEHQLLGDLGVGAAVRHEPEDVELALGEGGPALGGRPVSCRPGVAAGQEEVHGLGERGGVPAPREVVLAGELEEAGAGHPLGEVATERERDGAVAAPVQHQRRAAHGGESVGDIQLVDGPQRLGRQVAGRGPTLELRERLPLARVGAGQEDIGEHPRAQAPVRLHERDHLLAGGRGGDVRSACVAAVQHEPVGAVRVVRGVRRGDGAAGGRAQEVDPIGADGVDHAREHGDLGVPVGRRWAGPVGEPGSRAVVADHRGALGELADEAPERGVLPVELEVARPPAADHQDRPGADRGPGHRPAADGGVVDDLVLVEHGLESRDGASTGAAISRPGRSARTGARCPAPRCPANPASRTHEVIVWLRSTVPFDDGVGLGPRRREAVQHADGELPALVLVGRRGLLVLAVLVADQDGAAVGQHLPERRQCLHRLAHVVQRLEGGHQGDRPARGVAEGVRVGGVGPDEADPVLQTGLLDVPPGRLDRLLVEVEADHGGRRERAGQADRRPALTRPGVEDDAAPVQPVGDVGQGLDPAAHGQQEPRTVELGDAEAQLVAEVGVLDPACGGERVGNGGHGLGDAQEQRRPTQQVRRAVAVDEDGGVAGG